jgi:hypothetical protein
MRRLRDPGLRTDVTLVTMFESGGVTGVAVSGSNRWWIDASKSRWDRPEEDVH